MKLWQADHSYYCNEGNYFNNGCGAEYKTWAEFYEAEGDGDLDMNLVFRWDWREGEDWNAGEYTGDDYYRNGKLLVFFMGQRKGLYRWAEVAVCRADEPAVRAWLETRWEHMQSLWEPLASGMEARQGEDANAASSRSDDSPAPEGGDAQP